MTPTSPPPPRHPRAGAPIHIAGMGWLGSVLAFRLHRAGVPFTWHDIDSPFTAWKASTGMVYPAGDARSTLNLHQWARLAPLLPVGTVEQVAYCFAHKHPPHKGKYPLRADLGWVRVADAAAYAVDAPRVVAAARTRFAANRLYDPPTQALVVHAHGYSHRRGRYLWGWSAPVRLAIPADVTAATAPLRPTFYSRKDTFQIVYAYAIPGEPGLYWAGSTLQQQLKPATREPGKYFDRWRLALHDTLPGLSVTEVGAPVQGWRPAPRTGDPDGVTVNDAGIYAPPLWHSGVRWAPETTTHLAYAAGVDLL